MPVFTAPGSPAYYRITLALFLAGFATFSLLYCVQPLLPLLAREFHASPATSSLAPPYECRRNPRGAAG